MPYFGIPIRNGLPIGLGSVAGFGISPFDPSSLFAAGEQGAWYDPSDYSTLFTDSAGTTPVTGVEQFVGLMLDKSKGLVLGPELVTNGDFSGGSTGWTVISGTWTVANGRLNAGNTDGIKRYAQSASNIVAGRWYKATWNQYAGAGTGAAYWTVPGVWNGSDNLLNGGNYINGTGEKTIYFVAPVSGQFYIYNFEQEVEYDNFTVRELPGNHAFQTSSAKRPKLAARYNILLNSSTLATQNVTTQATDYTLRFEGAGTVTLSGTATGTLSAGVNTFTATAGTLTLTVSGTVTSADLRPSSQATGLIGPTYQRVVDAATYDTAGFLPYLAFDGLDDSMSTNSIDFSAGDKMTVWAGVRKLADSQSAISELSSNVNSNNGVFGLFTGFPSLTSTQWASKGTLASNADYTAAAPLTTVLTGIGNISGDVSTLRANGTQVATSATDQGTGNFGNYPLFIGARNNAGFFFQGWLTSLIVRGAQSTQSQIEATEAWVNGKTGAY